MTLFLMIFWIENPTSLAKPDTTTVCFWGEQGSSVLHLFKAFPKLCIDLYGFLAGIFTCSWGFVFFPFLIGVTQATSFAWKFDHSLLLIFAI